MADSQAFKLNYEGVGRMLNSPDIMGPVLLAAAEAVAVEARATAPYDASHGGQHWRDSFHIRLVVDEGRKGSRLAGQVYSTDPDGLHIETGTRHTPAHNTLSNALDVLG